jgi:hypothetical protein
MPTLLDVAKLNGTDAVTGLIEEANRAHPETALGAWRTIKGLNYKTKVRTGLPAASFRNFNEGSAAVKSTWENRLVEAFVLNPRWECDVALADKYEDGAEALLGIEAKGMIEAAFQTVAAQFYYGTGAGGDAKGFPALIQSYDSTNLVVDAGGTTATTGSSVWAVKFGPQDVQWILGAGGSIDVAPKTTQRILDGSSNPYSAYCQEMLAYVGLQVGSIYSIGRIKKVTADSGKTLTDVMIAQLLAKFPAAWQPDVLLMSRRSLMQLQSSRTSYNPTGAPAAIPDSAFNIPIRVSDAILNVEALTL